MIIFDAFGSLTYVAPHEQNACRRGLCALAYRRRLSLSWMSFQEDVAKNAHATHAYTRGIDG